MQYIYHVHAVHQNADGSLHHFDGIVLRSMKVLDYAGYTSLKTVLSEQIDGRPAPEKLIVQSLTYLGESE